MPRQLAFDLPVRPALGREDFFVSPANATALAALDAPEGWPGGKLVLTGPPGAGKTHLAHVWAAEQHAAILPAEALAGVDIAPLAARRAVVVEDAGLIAHLPDTAPDSARDAAEAALFHLHNLLAAEGGRLLLTATEPPSRWALRLPDLASRMQGTMVARIEPPDDALLTAMLAKLFADRGLAPRPAVLAYIVKRIDRSFAAAARITEALDAAALEAGGGVTVPMAAALLDKPAPNTE